MAPRAPEGRFSLDALLPGEGPLELDIGFGRGLSLFERAAAAPASRIVGVEIKAKWAYKVSQRLERRGLSGRVRVLCGDARELVSRVDPGGCVARAFVHFPDPWWKKRHAHRMVVGVALLDALGRVLEPGGELYVQTDVEERAAEYVAALAAHPDFRLAGRDGYVDHNPYGARSNREHRAEEDGLPVYRVLAHRRGMGKEPARSASCGGSSR
jgi:tRNA (guanine-N7-)-methyltransferase